MCVWMHSCVCVCVRTPMCVCVHVCVYDMYICVCMCVCMCMCVFAIRGCGYVHMCACFSAVKLLVLSFTATPQRCSSHCRGVWYRSSWTGWWTTSERPMHSELSDLGSSPLAIAPCTAQQMTGMTALKTSLSSEQGSALLSFLSSCLFYSAHLFTGGGGAFFLPLINFICIVFHSKCFCSSVQFRSVWYLCTQKSSAVVLLRSLKSPLLSQKFPKAAFETVPVFL